MFEQQPQQGGAAAPMKPVQPAPSATPVRPVPPVPTPTVTPSAAPQPVAVRPKADDIFAGTEPLSAPMRPIQATPLVPTDIKARSGVVWIALGIFVLVALIGGGIWLTLRPTTSTPITTDVPQDAVAPTAPDATVVDTSAAAPQVTTEGQVQGTPEQAADILSSQTDTDRDGLMDADEASFGTDRENADTDADGLSDSAEVRVYKTNPLDPDSDDDSFLDGAEVRAGYDPNGSGRLNDIERALEANK